MFAGIPYDELGDATIIQIELMYQAKLREMSFAARPHIEAMMNQVSAKSLAEALEKDVPSGGEDDAKRAKDRLLEEKGQPLKAELRQRLNLQFADDVSRALHVRQHGWPGAEEPLEPIKGVTSEIARTVWQLAKDGKLLKFDKYNAQMSSEDFARLELTAGIKREED